MKSIGVRELKEHLSEILRQVQEEGEPIEVTSRGVPIVRLIPVHQQRSYIEEDSAVWADLERLAAEIGAHWPPGVSAVDAIRDVRS